MLTGMPPFYSPNRNDMYQNIMKAQLVIPDIISAESRDFISLYSLHFLVHFIYFNFKCILCIAERILARRPEERLGSGPGEGSEVKNHSIFKSINWDQLGFFFF
jgi:serine/threonine protein kinase